MQRELEEIVRQRGKRTNYITIWNLPIWAKRSQVFESVRFLGRVKYIEMIKEASRKTRAEVDFEINTTNKEEL